VNHHRRQFFGSSGADNKKGKGKGKERKGKRREKEGERKGKEGETNKKKGREIPNRYVV
jgi:hypothetical protein